MTNWKTWPKRVFFFFSPEQQTCQIWIGHCFEIWNLIFGWARYKTEHRVEEVCCSKCFIVFVISFLVYFDKKVHKKKKKKNKHAKKFQPLYFAESNVHRKTNARGSFETYDLFFLALVWRSYRKLYSTCFLLHILCIIWNYFTTPCWYNFLPCSLFL